MRSSKARNELTSVFASTPYRPTGLATADQGLASVVQLLEWCSTLIADATDGHLSLDRAPAVRPRAVRRDRRGAQADR